MAKHARNKILQGVIFSSYALSFFVLYVILNSMVFYEQWLLFWFHATLNYPVWVYYGGTIAITLLGAVLIAFSSFILGSITISKLKLQQIRDELNG